MENKEKIEKIVKDAKDLLTILNEYKEKAEINTKSTFFKNIDRLTIAKHIIPYLDLKDIINFRTTCKDINGAISSTVAMVSYYKATNNKKQADLSKMFIRPVREMNDVDDVQMELQSLKNVILFNTDKRFPYTEIISI
jgi:hypothetical protein